MCSTRRYLGLFLPLLVVAALTGATGSAAGSTARTQSTVGTLVEQHGDSFATGLDRRPRSPSRAAAASSPSASAGSVARRSSAGVSASFVRTATRQWSHCRAGGCRRPRAQPAQTHRRPPRQLLERQDSAVHTRVRGWRRLHQRELRRRVLPRDSSWGQLIADRQTSTAGTRFPSTSTSCNYTHLGEPTRQSGGDGGRRQPRGYTTRRLCVPARFRAAPGTGWADLPGTRSVAERPEAMTLQVMAHELGHNFGQNHASSFICTENGVRVAALASGELHRPASTATRSASWARRALRSRRTSRAVSSAGCGREHAHGVRLRRLHARADRDL